MTDPTTRTERGYRLVCATDQPGHEGHGTYDDYDQVSPLFAAELDDPPLYAYIDGHLARLVSRTVTLGPWTPVEPPSTPATVDAAAAALALSWVDAALTDIALDDSQRGALLQLRANLAAGSPGPVLCPSCAPAEVAMAAGEDAGALTCPACGTVALFTRDDGHVG